MPCRARAAAVAESTLANSVSRRVSHGKAAPSCAEGDVWAFQDDLAQFPWSAEEC